MAVILERRPAAVAIVPLLSRRGARGRWPNRRRVGAVLAVVAVAGAASAPAASAGVRVGAAPQLPAGTRPLAMVVGARTLHVTVALRPRSPAALAAYAAAVADPASPRFRRYLSVGAFRRRFAPAPRTVAAVRRSLQAHGLRPGALSANGLSIGVSAPAGALERAFATQLAEVRLPGEGEAIIATAAPAFDRSVADAVQAVVGLSTLYHPRPGLMRPPRAAGSGGGLSRGHVATGGPEACSSAAATAAAQHAYTADQIASAYDFTGLYRDGDQGQGVTVAVYELESDDPADIAAYQSCYGTHASVAYVPVDGGAGSGPGTGEAALDIEQLIGLAPRARLLVYQAPNSNLDSPGSGPYDLDSAIVSQDRAQVVSSSWGECEPTEGATDAAAENTLFEEAAVQGQTFVSAAGDSGSEDCDAPPPSVPDTRLAVDDPAAQPFVTGVGGTSLAAAGPPPSETVWNNGGQLTGLLGVALGAGGGGISSLWPMPAYQSLAAGGLHVTSALSSGAPCAAAGHLCRQVPDVSADADPQTGYIIYYNGTGQDPMYPSGWQATGGTSAAAPLWAAVLALADADRACRSAAIGFANPALYRVAARDGAGVLHDVTAGNNDFTGTSGGRYPAGAGYDMASGLGSPRAAALAPALCAEGLRLATPRPHFSFRGRALSFALPVFDGPGGGLALRVRGLPAGLRQTSPSGLITGRPRRIGRSLVTISATDSGGARRTVSFAWTVDDAPSVSVSRALTVVVRAGRLGPPLSSVEVTLPAGLSLASARRVAAPGARVSGSGRRVLVQLRRAAPAVRIAFGRGALRGSGAPGAPVRITVRDTGGQRYTTSVGR